MSYIGNSPGVASQRVTSSFTATAGQTIFTPVSGYTLGYVDVYLNGVKLAPEDFTAENGISITLAVAAQINDTLELVCYFPRGLSDGYLKSEIDASYGNVDNTSDADKPVSTATQTALNLKANIDSPSLTGNAVITSNSTSPALRITQTGTGAALLVEDEASDSTPFVVDAAGNVGVGTSSPTSKLSVDGSVNVTGNVTLGDASTDTVTVNGYIGVGSAPGSQNAIYVGSDALTGANQTGVSSAPTGTSAAVTAVRAFSATPLTAAEVFTTGYTAGLIVNNAIKGAGSTITDQHGVRVQDQTQGTNNFGITSLVSSGTNKWNIYASGTAANYFAGNVGIGTSAPVTPLTVGTDSRTTSEMTLWGQYQASGFTNANNFYFRHGGVNRWAISTKQTGVASNQFTLSLRGINSSAGAFHDFLSIDGLNGTLAVRTSSDGGATANERLRIDSSGNLGLGVVPSGWGANWPALQLPGGGSIVGRRDTLQINMLHNGYYDGGGFRYVVDGFASRYVQNSGVHQWLTAPSGTAGNAITFTERMTLDSSGNLLVGTTNTAQNAGNGTKIYPRGNVSVVNDGTTSGGDGFDFYNSTAGAYRFYVTGAGTIFATTTTISAISDQRLKENVRDLDVGLDAVMALKPRKFDWKDGKGKNVKDDRGWIAQEFEQVFPDLIDEWKDPSPEGEEPYKSVRADLIPVLVKAIQEQQALIESLTARITALESA